MKVIGKVIGWQKRYVGNEEMTDIYLFNNPEIVKCSANYFGVHPINNDYIHYQFIGGCRVALFPETGALNGIGINKDCLFELDKISINELSEKIRIKKLYLETILSDSKPN